MTRIPNYDPWKTASQPEEEDVALEDERNEYDRMREIAEKHGCTIKAPAPRCIGQWTILEVVDQETDDFVGVLEWDEESFEASLIEAIGKKVAE